MRGQVADRDAAVAGLEADAATAAGLERDVRELDARCERCSIAVRRVVARLQCERIAVDDPHGERVGRADAVGCLEDDVRVRVLELRLIDVERRQEASIAVSGDDQPSGKVDQPEELEHPRDRRAARSE